MNLDRRIVATLLTLLVTPIALAHSPTIDSDASDWCWGADSTVRSEDDGGRLSCGGCSVSTGLACNVDDDCPGSESCVDPGSREEIVWWDARGDGAVNDVATFAITEDAGALYFSLRLWVDPDPQALPFVEVALNWKDGGIDSWYDPDAAIVRPGSCSASTDRGCTRDADCHFCALSNEPDSTTRRRICGSGCNPDLPDDLCVTTEQCLPPVDNSTIDGVGRTSVPGGRPDALLVIDFGRWLIGAQDSVQLMLDVGGSWTAVAAYPIIVNPGTGQPGTPGTVEWAVPRADLVDLAENVDLRFTLLVTRGEFHLDYRPDGAIEDLFSEAIAGSATTSGDDCPAPGPGATLCELADGSIDAFVPRACDRADADGDGTCDLDDACPLLPNPLFAETIVAPDADRFSWSTAFEIDWVRGELAALPSYAVEASGSETAASELSLADVVPAQGSGTWWLLRPDCPVSSWGDGGRDAALPAP